MFNVQVCCVVICYFESWCLTWSRNGYPTLTPLMHAEVKKLYVNSFILFVYRSMCVKWAKYLLWLSVLLKHVSTRFCDIYKLTSVSIFGIAKVIDWCTSVWWDLCIHRFPFFFCFFVIVFFWVWGSGKRTTNRKHFICFK